MNKKFLSIIIFLCLTLGGFLVEAQSSVSLTITPPLIKINMNPGERWTSSIKIVNDNPQTLTTYVQKREFKSGEEGGVVFLPEPNEEEKELFLSEWIEMSLGPFNIPPFQSKEVPFTIVVPPDAEPGGHYAAILVGTQPSQGQGGTAIRVASQVSSLVLLNVQGEVEESGWIREFSTGKDFYQKPEVDFTVSFENLGNVHLQPVGEIKIYNMWGKERGTIPLNRNTEFGNVLPNSKKVWSFTWKGDDSLFEVGRYRAELFLGFGNQARQTASSTLYFWVIPLVPVIGIVGGILLFLTVLILGIRSYIRKAIFLAQKEAGLISEAQEEEAALPPLRDVEWSPRMIQAPIRKAILDLRKLNTHPLGQDKIVRAGFFLKKYYKMALFFLVMIMWGGIAIFYVQDINQTEKEFQVSRSDQEQEAILSQEDIFKAELSATQKEGSNDALPEEDSSPVQEETTPGVNKENFSIKVLNGSGVPGAASETAEQLRNQGFQVNFIGNADSFNYQRTVIQYKEGKEEEAELVASFFPESSEITVVQGLEEDVVVIFGKDYTAE
ncbi:MAG: hypothetical protein GF370_04805 [Candidatus Nealsonbacteria bacterium]|nr:hypothetical protein [Candidatus Nealsonbacteria bacterium]